MATRIHFIGRKNSGKTTLVCDLVEKLTERGFKVATIKHTHHKHELDTPGKDSHKHREAGAAAVGILTPEMTALFLPVSREEQNENKYELFDLVFADYDVVLVEGDTQTKAIRIEVWRSVVSEQPYAAEDSQIAAIVSDETPSNVHCEIWARSEIDTIAARIIALAASGQRTTNGQ